jgi:hypothetical protein
MKWQEKRNQNLHMIVEEEHEDRPRVVLFMQGGRITGVNVTYQGIRTSQWVSKVAKPPLMFYPQNERDTYKKQRKDFLQIEWGASTS